jgi:hypothetical protein
MLDIKVYENKDALTRWDQCVDKMKAWIVAVGAPYPNVPRQRQIRQIAEWLYQWIVTAIELDRKREDLLLVETPEYAFPLVRQMTPDRGLIHTNLFDLFNPYWDAAVVKWFQTNPIDGLHFEPCVGREEYVIDCNFDSFETHVKTLGIVKDNKKFWTTLSFVVDDHVTLDEVQHMLKSNWEHFNEPLEQVVEDGKTVYKTLRKGVVIPKLLMSMPLNYDKALKVYLNQELVSVAFVQINEGLKEMYWLQAYTLRTPETDKLQVGKFIPYALIKTAYATGYTTVNMGIAHYDYKARWAKRKIAPTGFDLMIPENYIQRSQHEHSI